MLYFLEALSNSERDGDRGDDGGERRSGEGLLEVSKTFSGLGKGTEKWICNFF